MKLLSFTSKMPDASFSLEAWKTCPTANRVSVHDDSICRSCYARKGFYVFKNVFQKQRQRLAFILKSLRSNNGDEFVSAMVAQIKENKVRLFRIHDSGDLFSVPYIKAWARICSALPDVKFWCPTREWATDDKAKLAELRKLAKLPNVALRPSALRFNDPAPKIRGFAAGSTAVTSLDKATCRICPTGIDGNPDSCAKNGCFSCWDKNSAPVAFVRH